MFLPRGGPDPPPNRDEPGPIALVARTRSYAWTMARVEHAAVAVIILVAFVADLRLVVPTLAVLLAGAVLTKRIARTTVLEVALLATASGAFLLDGEVLAWAAALAAAAVAGLRVAAPRTRQMA